MPYATSSDCCAQQTALGRLPEGECVIGKPTQSRNSLYGEKKKKKDFPFMCLSVYCLITLGSSLLFSNIQ